MSVEPPVGEALGFLRNNLRVAIPPLLGYAGLLLLIGVFLLGTAGTGVLGQTYDWMASGNPDQAMTEALIQAWAETVSDGFLASLGLLMLGMITVSWLMSVATYGLILSRLHARPAGPLMLRRALPFLALRILIILVTAAPVVGAALLAAGAILSGETVLIILSLLGVPLAMLASIYLSMRLLLAGPGLFWEGGGPIQAMRRSAGVTRSHFRALLAVFVIVIGISFVNGQVRGAALQALVGGIGNGYVLAIGIMLSLALLAVVAAMSAYDHIFLMLSYERFRNN